MAGYIGKSMSRNAAVAYVCGEKPLTKWTKTAILEEIEEHDVLSDELFAEVKKLTAAELKQYFLKKSSWHHTGAFYACTDFYSIDDDFISYVTLEEIKDIISKRTKKARRTRDEIAKEKAEKEARKNAKDAKKEVEILFKFQNKYKTVSGLLRAVERGNIDLDTLFKLKNEKIAEKREQLLKQWTSQKYIYGLERINDDDFVSQYIK